MGTSELYRAVEELPEISTAWWSTSNTWASESYMPLFVVMRPGDELTPRN
jgi:acetoacetyl-CoA synthetase